MHRWLLLGWLLTEYEQVKKNISSLFADFEQVTKLMTVLLTLLTLSNSKKVVIFANYDSKKVIILLALNNSKKVVILRTLNNLKKQEVVLLTLKCFLIHPQQSQSGHPWLPTPHCAAPVLPAGRHASVLSKCFPPTLYSECHGFEREPFLLLDVFYLALLPAVFKVSLEPEVHSQYYQGFMLIFET